MFWNVEPTIWCEPSKDRLGVRRLELRRESGEEINDLFERQKLVCTASGQILHRGRLQSSVTDVLRIDST